MKKGQTKGGGRQSSSDDDEAWRHTAATIEPLKRGKPRVHPAATAPKSTNVAPRATAAEPVRKSRPAFPERQPRTHAVPPSPPSLAEFDRSAARKIRTGRAEIEARVDLHGMRQDEAHAALKAFLARCHGRGLRFVLVITGKGKAGPLDASQGPSHHEGRGVLKRNVPRWLEESDLRSIVVSYATAAIQHGGEGAIYVHLRAKHRT